MADAKDATIDNSAIERSAIDRSAGRPLPAFPAVRRAPPALPPALVAAGIGLRGANRGDLPFLHTLYRALHASVFALAPWSQAEREAVIRDQFERQHRHLLGDHPRADYWIVERAFPERTGPERTGPELGGDGPIPIGRYYLRRHGRVWRALDIGLLPGERGFGGALLRWTQAQVVAAGASGVDLHVAHDNPRARALYLRLGFRDVDPPLDFHQRMLWLADSEQRGYGERANGQRGGEAAG